MMRTALLLALVAIAPASLLAHHGSASFDTSKKVTLTGTVTEWIWANPHCFLKIDAQDDAGEVRNWSLETQNPVGMTQRGWSRSAFTTGDRVTVVIEAVKNGAPVGRIVSVKLPNGTTLEAGTLPTTPPSGR
ncbi:MAG: hypothetical protein DMF87_03320 [Acidobacteria bacterium]|nr:MAG: hypothetical protein DMF87_03320 [Acidobacteriota bacterium]